MSNYQVLVSCPLIQDNISEYSDVFKEHGIVIDVPKVDQHLSETELLEIIDRYDGIIAGDDEFTESVLKSGTNLKVISKWGIGTDNINKSVAEEEGIAILNTPGAFSDEVANIVFAYLLMLTRDLHHIDREVRQGNWICPRGVSLAGKTIGIVGVGSIGTAVAERAIGFNMEILGTDVEPISTKVKESTGMNQTSLSTLLEDSDVVTLHCPLTDDTKNLIGSQELNRLGGSGFLINTSRGGLVNEESLIRALERGTIKGAGLDVFEEEPLSRTNKLTKLDNVVLGSHNAQNTHEAVARVNDRAVWNLLRGLGAT